MNNRLINTKVAGGGGGGCTDIVDNFDPFDGGGVGLWQLNGNADDLSPNENDGTFIASSYGAGVFGQAGVFNGSTSKIDFTNPIPNTDTDCSYSVWVNFSSVPTTGSVCLFGNQSANVFAPFITFIYFQSDGVGISFERCYGSTTEYANNYNTAAKSVLTAGTWYNISAVYDASASTAKIYLNGSFLGTHNLIPQSTGRTTSTSATIGAYQSGSFFNGSIDQVRIFNTALTPLEVEALYTEELCICDGTVDTLQVLGDTSCIATYQLDGNANDLSGNYSGTPTDVSYGVGEFDLCLTAGRVQNPDYNLTNQVSVSGWYKTNADGSVWALGQGGDNPLIACDTWRAYFEGNGTQSDTLSLPSVNTNAWTHIVQVIDLITHTQTVYINKVAYSNSIPTDNTAIGNLASTNGLGTDTSSAAFSLNGLDQVRIFNKALNSTEVDILFAESACAKGACAGTTHTLNILGGGDTSCIAAYPLDGSPADLSGNYNGVQTDVTYPQGYFDLAGSFGTSSIQTELTTAFNLQEFSFSFWAKPSLVNSTNQELLGNYSSANQGWILRLTDSNKFSFLTSLPAVYATSTTTPVVDTWYNIVVTNSSSNGVSKIYINNSLEDTVTYTAGTQIPYTAGGMNLAWVRVYLIL